MWKRETSEEDDYYLRRELRATAVVKSIIESKVFASSIDMTHDDIFSWATKKIEDYTRAELWVPKDLPNAVKTAQETLGGEIKRPLSSFSPEPQASPSSTTQNPNNWPVPVHVTLKNGEKVMFATQPQHGRAYAVAMSNGWDQKAYKNFLFKEYGISDNRKSIPACFYDEIIDKLKQGPTPF